MPAETSHHLPVTIRVAASDDDLRRVLALRASAGAPGSRPAANAPEVWDLRPNATLLLAESRVDGEALGSLRILAGERGRLMVEDRVDLPASLKAVSIAEASALTVRAGRDATLVRLMLWKAFHRHCLAAQVDSMLIAVRAEAQRQYEWLGFHDPSSGALRFAADGGAPTYRVMTLGVFEAHERSQRAGHPLHDFFFVERHPEIDLLAPVADHRPPRRRPGGAASLPDHARIAAQLQEVAFV